MDQVFFVLRWSVVLILLPIYFYNLARVISYGWHFGKMKSERDFSVLLSKEIRNENEK